MRLRWLRGRFSHTDDRDAETIAEAATRPTMRFVSLKSEIRLDLQVLHRARERLVLARTSLINQFRAVLLERGITLPKGRGVLMRRLDKTALVTLEVSIRTRQLLEDLLDECAALDRRIKAYDEESAVSSEHMLGVFGAFEPLVLIEGDRPWPAPGFEDTELGVLMGPEGGHGETEVYARVQA